MWLQVSGLRSPVNYESKLIFPQIGNKNSDSLDVAEQQISQLKQKTYAAVVKDRESISVVRFYTRRFSGT